MINTDKNCIECKALPLADGEDKKKILQTLMGELKNTKIKFSLKFTPDRLLPGYGDECCNVINDLTTEILIRKDYAFKEPDFTKPDPANGNPNNGGQISANDDSNDDIDQEEEYLHDSDDENFSDGYENFGMTPLKKNDTTNGAYSTTSTMNNTTKFKSQQKNFIEPEVDPKDWYAECQDMAPQFQQMESDLTEMLNNPTSNPEIPDYDIRNKQALI
jgi:hypothetical protein